MHKSRCTTGIDENVGKVATCCVNDSTANLPPVSTTPVANLPPVSITPMASFATGTAGVVDTGGPRRARIRVSSKQTKIYFGLNRNKPKQDLFRVCFGLFRETKTEKFRFVSGESISKQPKQTELFCNKPKQP